MSIIQPDFKYLFESVPGLYLILLPDFTIATASDSYLAATMTKREEIIGRNLFDVFPDNPQDPSATGASSIRASILSVIENKNSHTMGVLKYDIPKPDGSFEERYWSPLNKAILNEKGEVAYIINRVEDVTNFVKMRSDKEKQDRDNANLRERVQEMEVEIYNRSQEIQIMNETLQEQVNIKTAELTDIFDRLTDGFIGYNKAGKIIFINKRAMMLTGISEDQVKGKHITEAFDPSAWDPLFKEAFHRAVEENEPGHVEVYASEYNSWLAVDLYPSDSGLSIFFRDISERKKCRRPW